VRPQSIIELLFILHQSRSITA